jgi:3-methyl-2-oxobutanoate hydroxymethyltransferase
VRDERVRALSGFRADVASGGYPSEAETAGIADDELGKFRTELDGSKK